MFISAWFMCGKGKATFAFEWHVYEIKWDWGSGD